MVRLLVVLLIALSMSAAAAFGDMYTEIHGDGIYTVAENEDASRRVEKMRREIEIGGLKRLAEHTARDLDALMKIAAWNLKRKKYYSQASQLEREWKYHRVALTSFMMEDGRAIGDFEPLSQWLAEKYEMLELILGYEVCRALRLSDIKTFNYTIPVVFKPCEHGLPEFELHFIHDDRYRGLMPVVSYWATSITCSIATFGAGYFFICSPIAMLVEVGVDKWAAPWLAPRIFNMACSK